MTDGRAHDRTERVLSRKDEDDSALEELERSASFSDRSSTQVIPNGLSRRGWLLLIACVGAAAVVLLSLSGLAIGSPARSAPSGIASASPHVSPHGAAAEPQPSDQPSPSPTANEVATVPAQPVSTLTTGDCLQTYPSPWADGYPVVDCGAPHIAQVLSTGTLSQPSDAPFPGSKALDDQVTGLCSEPGLLDWDWVAIWNEDVYVDVRYPNTNALWTSGARTYYCFVYTYSRHELTGSAVPSA